VNEQAGDQFRPPPDSEFSEDISEVEFYGLLAYREPLADLKVCHPFGARQGNLSLSTTQVVVARDALNGTTKTCGSLVNLYLFRVGEEAKRAAALENLFGLENPVEMARARAALTFFGICALNAQFA
jgi:hypothetical protein